MSNVVICPISVAPNIKFNSEKSLRDTKMCENCNSQGGVFNFLALLSNFVLGTETRLYVMTAYFFKIFLKFPHFLTS